MPIALGEERIDLPDGAKMALSLLINGVGRRAWLPHQGTDS